MLTPQTIKKFNIGLNISNHERDLVSFSFLVRNGTSREKRDVENSREKWTRLEKIYYYIVPSIAWYILVRHTNKPNLNSVCLFIHLSACLSVRPSVCLSVCIPALLSALRLTLSGRQKCVLFDWRKLRNCFISRLVSFSVSREVLTSRLGLVSVQKT